MNAPVENRRSNGLLRKAWMVAAAFFLFGFALVPIYRIACEHVLGIKLDREAASASRIGAMTVDASRWVTVQFIATTNSKLPWDFSAEKATLKVHPGQLSEAWFNASNTSVRAIVGNAVPSIAPNSASLYFNKTECFCFTEQQLQAGESRRMPVRFIVDPKLPSNIDTLTLSYTFYENDIATRKIAGSPEKNSIPVATPAS